MLPFIKTKRLIHIAITILQIVFHKHPAKEKEKPGKLQENRQG